jgi:hypothetical protein
MLYQDVFLISTDKIKEKKYENENRKSKIRKAKAKKSEI